MPSEISGSGKNMTNATDQTAAGENAFQAQDLLVEANIARSPEAESMLAHIPLIASGMAKKAGMKRSIRI